MTMWKVCARCRGGTQQRCGVVKGLRSSVPVAWSLTLLIVTLTPASAFAAISQSPPPSSVPPPDDFGIDFVTVGAPGNAAYNGPDSIFSFSVKGRGSVPYAYRISRTEVTMGDWFEFLQAYAPFVDPLFANSSSFTTTRTFQTGFDANGVPVYQPISPALEGFVANPSWRFAARYVNWLNSGKAITRDAFESGVYDTSTFGEFRDDGGNIILTDQMTRSPGAKFWIPTLDEWMKAAHYDPNKFGPGQEGWWTHPGGQDEPLTPGLPGEPGAQSGAGLSPFDVPPEVVAALEEAGLYPDTSAPWVLLDASGTIPEWIGDTTGGLNARIVAGSPSAGGSFAWPHSDQVNVYGVSLSTSGGPAFRIATVVPAPSVLTLTLLAVMPSMHRRRRKDS